MRISDWSSDVCSSDLMGEMVASKLCTIVDDGTLAGRRGSLSVDDEGTPTECTTLIENGVLKGYMQDKLNARLMGVARTGNGRRESYAHLPMPRMTNTYMLGGQSDPEIGRAHVCTPVTNEHLVCRLLLEKK